MTEHTWTADKRGMAGHALPGIHVLCRCRQVCDHEAVRLDAAVLHMPELVPDLVDRLTEVGVTVTEAIEPPEHVVVLVVPGDLPDASGILRQAATRRIPTVLTSLSRRSDDDLTARQERTFTLRADAYADTAQGVARAIWWLCRDRSPSRVSGNKLRYLGALFNRARITLGVEFAIDAPQSLLGRGRNADVLLHSPQVARLHVRLQCTGDAHTVTDCGGTNGTWLQRADWASEPLEHGVARPFGPGDELIVAGSFRFRFCGVSD